MDRSAGCLNEDILLPPLDLARVSDYKPAVGWERLDSAPGTVQEYHWTTAGKFSRQ